MDISTLNKEMFLINSFIVVCIFVISFVVVYIFLYWDNITLTKLTSFKTLLNVLNCILYTLFRCFYLLV